MELRVNDYVRTNTGQIGKITYFEGDMVRVDCDKFITYKNNHNEITKISPKIIDLIEVGDYVNGYKVTMLEDEYYDDATDSVKKIKDKEKIKIILGNEEQFYGVYAKDIKSIVTREMFESMEYKVEE